MSSFHRAPLFRNVVCIRHDGPREECEEIGAEYEVGILRDIAKRVILVGGCSVHSVVLCRNGVELDSVDEVCVGEW